VVPRECHTREEDQDDETRLHDSNLLRNSFHDWCEPTSRRYSNPVE